MVIRWTWMQSVSAFHPLVFPSLHSLLKQRSFARYNFVWNESREEGLYEIRIFYSIIHTNHKIINYKRANNLNITKIQISDLQTKDTNKRSSFIWLNFTCIFLFNLNDFYNFIIKIENLKSFRWWIL